MEATAVRGVRTPAAGAVAVVSAVLVVMAGLVGWPAPAVSAGLWAIVVVPVVAGRVGQPRWGTKQAASVAPVTAVAAAGVRGGVVGAPTRPAQPVPTAAGVVAGGA